MANVTIFLSLEDFNECVQVSVCGHKPVKPRSASGIRVTIVSHLLRTGSHWNLGLPIT